MITKPKYIRKYDFLRTFYWQKSWWLNPKEELDSKLKSLVFTDQVDFLDIDLDDEDEESEQSFDYNLYKEIKEDDNKKEYEDYLMQQGIIIEQTFNKTVQEYFRLETFDLDTKLSNEQRHNKTLELLQSKKDCIIIQGALIYDGIIAKPDAIVIKDKKVYLIECKGSSSTKILYLLDLYYQKSVFDLCNIPVEDYYIGIIKYEKLQKNKTSIELTNYCVVSKSYSKPSKLDNLLPEEKEIIIRNSKIGYFGGLKIKYILQSRTLDQLEFFYENETKLDKKGDEAKKLVHSEESILYFFSINFLDRIQSLKEHSIQEPTIDEKDIFTYFKDLEFYKEYVKPWLAQKYKYFEWTGSINKSTKKIWQANPEIAELESKMSDTYKTWYDKEEDVFNIEQISQIEKSIYNKMVYFDFETINSAIRAIDNTYPFEQIITQCSITYLNKDNLSSMRDEDLIFDPLNLQLSDYEDMIDKIYQGEETSYIVYNKSFERSCLKRLIDFIPSKTKQINDIIANLVDLADFFTIKKNFLPIFIKELKGYYSIKKVLKIIPEHLLEASGSKPYKELAVQNGLQAQIQTLRRFYGLMNDKDWNELKIKLKSYCNNDVRAMIAVYFYVLEILKNN
jgi:hypothetical protein